MYLSWEAESGALILGSHSSASAWDALQAAVSVFPRALGRPTPTCPQTRCASLDCPLSTTDCACVSLSLQDGFLRTAVLRVLSLGNPCLPEPTIFPQPPKG